MPRFRDTKGLVIDVRGNGGGTREALRALAGYLRGPKDPPWVGNFAVYRRADAFGADHLAARSLFRFDDARWDDDARAAIDRAFAGFSPKWQPPASDVSDWHAMVLGRTGHDGEYAYDRPVVILSDGDCFSATDVFLGALAVLPNVTLMGTASAGGSARAQRFVLPGSQLVVTIASMASYQPDGKMFDGEGVEPDVRVAPRAGFFLAGGEDAPLAAAVRRLHAGRRKAPRP